jgi:predicted nucleic acid-binding protein
VNYYYDTSALCRHYHSEPGSDEVSRIIAESGARHYLSWLTIVELHSALAQRVRTRDITARKLKTLSTKIKTDVARHPFHVVRMAESYFDHAVDLILKHGPKQRLRAGDSLHLAIALRLQQIGLIDRFVTADTVLSAVGATEGLIVFNPLAT